MSSLGMRKISALLTEGGDPLQGLALKSCCIILFALSIVSDYPCSRTWGCVILSRCSVDEATSGLSILFAGWACAGVAMSRLHAWGEEVPEDKPREGNPWPPEHTTTLHSPCTRVAPVTRPQTQDWRLLVQQGPDSAGTQPDF